MLKKARGSRLVAIVLAAAALCAGGCTAVGDYFRNGLKVGPNYSPPAAPVAEHWIDEADQRVRTDAEPPSRWWTVFGDPTLNHLIETAASQNLSLREAGFRIMEARAQLGIAEGNFFPQKQDFTASYSRFSVPGRFTIVDRTNLPPPLNPPPDEQILNFNHYYTEQWNTGFNLAWELDFWGRFRRAIASAEASLDASVANYDYVLVLLLGEVARHYVQARKYQREIEFFRANAKLQQVTVETARRRFEEGQRNELDLAQARSTLAFTESQIPPTQIFLRSEWNALCTLTGIPPADLEKQLGEGPIPVAPPEVVVGIPAELLRRRPDVRREERRAAAQAEKIGIAEADFYPIISFHGTLSWQANYWPDLFKSNAFTGSAGPGVQWNLLNYGRILNNVRSQNAAFQAQVAYYQNTVLKANEEVENGIVTFLRSQEAAKLLDRSVANGQKAESILSKQFQEGAINFAQLTVIQQNLVTQQREQSAAYANIALGLIQVYRALGGGWEVPVSQAPSEETPPATVSPAPPPAVPLTPVPPAKK